LHAFQKKSKKGIETAKRDVDLIKKRFTEAQELAHEFEKAKTNWVRRRLRQCLRGFGAQRFRPTYGAGADWCRVFKILEDKNLKQREIADVLGIAQPDVSHLMNGHFSRFTTDKLLDFLKRLNRKVTIEVSRHHKGEPYRRVTFAP
jgi:DNA-binding Xre family transcriptional regulator